MTDAEAAQQGAVSCIPHGESDGAVVLRVKRRVTEEPLPTLALHAKKLRLQAGGGSGAAVFRLAGTLGEHTDPVALQQAVARAIKAEGTTAAPQRERRSAAAPSGRRRKRYRILRRVELSAGGQRAQKRKRQSAEDASKDVVDGAAAADTATVVDGDAKRSKGVHVFDVEFDSSQEARCDRSLDDYRRQLDSITMNNEQLVCSDAGDLVPPTDMESDFVYDLYLPNTGPGDFVMTSDLGTDAPSEDEELDEGGWAFLLDGYEEDYSFPNEYRLVSHPFDDDDSDPESESNWRNEYPDVVGFEERECCSEEDFEMWMGGRETGLPEKDSDDELGGYADDDDLERGLREMELSKGAAKRDTDSEEEDEDLDQSRERRQRAEASRGPHSMQQMRQMFTELLHERSNMA